ncbi:hypothetical protein PR048_004767 [Dryococelus australis]|uniref:RNA-directed DNA polymerase from mobile element jockey n=1 Tax=Dryococelus australis TaxID=614101 RepID=A0ABQ9I6B5_9NEOP|nr:hypothetical protein PR048_004767 [Dryococelus australis]
MYPNANNKNRTAIIHHSNLIILTWNAHSLKYNYCELIRFMKHHKIDIALISETHLKPKKLLEYPRPPHIQKRQGKKIIRKGIKHHVQARLENCTIVLPNKNGDISITAAYSPPKANDIQEFIEHTISFPPYS